ncbi:Membralin [Phytophthora nicotianae]|uniref:Membralin n=1 Tax=Phytophthora nicotianae TaxID=4792 RepID=A0A0W8DGR4_PHYNI|nr:Membralin [Phytophthora nicotianae]
MESVDAALRYLQRQFASVASDEAHWNEERQKLQAQVRELEDQRSEQEQAYKDAMLRVKMLEFALRQERGRYLASPAAVSSAGGSSTKPRTESTEVSRGVTVTRSKSGRTIEQPSPAPSPAGSPKAYSIYRTDSRNKSASSTPKNSQGKGTEISRPRMMSRTASGREVEHLTLQGELRCTSKTNTNGTGPNIGGSLVPTSVHSMLTDPKTCVVGYTNGSIAQFDYAAERVIQLTRAIDVDTKGRGGQVNKITVHPTMPVAIAAHQDRKIRMYDMRAGTTGLMRELAAHGDDLTAAHRPKLGEAVHSVTYHSSRNFIATGGADSTIKIFQ